MPDIASVIKMSDLYHISLDELLKGDQDMMKKIEKDTNIVRSNSRLIAVGIVAIIVAVVVIFASIMTGNAVLDFLAAALPWVFMGIALACFLATRKPDENTPKLRVAGFIPIMIGVMFMIGGIYLMNACMWRGIGIGALVVGIVLNGVGLVILFYRKKYKDIILLIPSFLILLVCFVSPANTYFRYALPNVFALPLMLLMFDKIISKKDK